MSGASVRCWVGQCEKRRSTMAPRLGLCREHVRALGFTNLASILALERLYAVLEDQGVLWGTALRQAVLVRLEVRAGGAGFQDGDGEVADVAEAGALAVDDLAGEGGVDADEVEGALELGGVDEPTAEALDVGGLGGGLEGL